MIIRLLWSKLDMCLDRLKKVSGLITHPVRLGFTKDQDCSGSSPYVAAPFDGPIKPMQVVAQEVRQHEHPLDTIVKRAQPHGTPVERCQDLTVTVRHAQVKVTNALVQVEQAEGRHPEQYVPSQEVLVVLFQLPCALPRHLSFQALFVW